MSFCLSVQVVRMRSALFAALSCALLLLTGAEFSIDDAALFRINFNSAQDGGETAGDGAAQPEPPAAGGDPESLLKAAASEAAAFPDFDQRGKKVEDDTLTKVIMTSTNKER